MLEQSIRTTDAIRIVGIPLADWRRGVDRGDYACAPPTVNRVRVFTNIDELVALHWFNALLKSGAKALMAGSLANALSEAMKRRPKTKQFNVYCWNVGFTGHLSVDITPPLEAPDAEIIMLAPVGEWRTKMKVAIDRYFLENPR